ncbi:MAG TPA: GNAT family N-acetyltransferase [Firmicutes bacterium]|jgi:ribosomal-protein-alanine N-acetyltransferase|nr:GNAT family N-acetyltransferase [Bacillota bacterium]
MSRMETKRLIIRDFSLSDAEVIFYFSQEESLKQWLPDQVYSNIDEAKETLEFMISKYPHKELPFVLAVVEKESNELVGHVGLSRIKQGIEIGYAIGKQHQNKGYASEAVAAFSDWGKRDFGIKEIYGVVDSENHASIKVLENAGFRFVRDDVEGEFGKGRCRKTYVK